MKDLSSCAGADSAVVPASEVLAQLQRILSSERFSSLERLRAFLRYVVEETLHGRGDQLKEVVIAMEAYGRDGAYDPRLDATVRVQAGRLRQALKEYYETQGQEDSVLIEIPKGSYAPSFQWRTPPTAISPPTISLLEAPPVPDAITIPAAASSPARRRLWPLGVAVAAILLATLGIFFYLHRRPALGARDTIVLADFTNTTGDPVFDGALRQALSTGLEQSPFLNILSRQAIEQTLSMMGRAADSALTKEVAQDVCLRAGSQVVVNGSIARLDQLYVVGLSAVNCATGETLADEQVRAGSKEQVLRALDEATAGLRRKLGESRASIRKFTTPLEQATTPSLPALQAYSNAVKARRMDDNGTAVALFQRAIELDPQFAIAYSRLGVTYFGLGQPLRASEFSAKAFQLRDRVTEHERLYIESHYYHFATGQLEKAAQTYEQWEQLYPHESIPSGNLGVIYSSFGNYPAAIAKYREALSKDPEMSYGYADLAEALLNAGQITEAMTVLHQMQAHHLKSVDTQLASYLAAFLRNDGPEMAAQLTSSAGTPTVQTFLSYLQANTEAWHGRLANSRTAIQEAVASAIRSEANEIGAVWEAEGALHEAEFGYPELAQQQAASALALSGSKNVRTLVALAWARCGQTARARSLAAELDHEFPADTLLQTYWLPAIGASIELAQQHPEQALTLLQTAAPYDLAQVPPFQPVVIGPMYPAYLRGQALLLCHREGEANTEFAKLIDHPGVVMNYPLGVLARLGRARAYAQQGDRARSGQAYQEFLALWQNADPQLPLLRQAQAEAEAVAGSPLHVPR